MWLWLSLLLQTIEPLLPVTVQCALDTELPLSEIRVRVEEKRELRETPGLDGVLTLRDLPAGDLNVVFYWNEDTLGQVSLSRARLGDFIRIRVRLVEGNAILLEEFRVKGVSDSRASGTVSPVTAAPSDALAPDARSPTREISPAPAPAPQPTVDSALPVGAPPSQPIRLQPASSGCPAPDEPINLDGVVVRIIDNDSFELETSERRRFIVYVGTATKLRPSGGRISARDLKPNERVRVRGVGAAGPEDECSVGAREIARQE
jgi:hypothetical protein